jgi:hypothetical protein
MPYIKPENRERAAKQHGPMNVGELTYSLTLTCVRFARFPGKISFFTIALVMGALFCTALEFYRRAAAPYEDTKIQENGDVYS